MSNIITIQLFGAFRDYNTENSLTLPRPETATVKDIKLSIAKNFNGTEPFTSLLSHSRLADDQKIYSENATLSDASLYALLPPVNGG